MRQLPARFALRKLLAAAVRRERNYLYAALGGRSDSDLEELAERLAVSLCDIAEELAPLAGDPPKDRLVALLRDHSAIFVRIVRAMKAKDEEARGKEISRWYSNVNDLATVISGPGRLAKPHVAGNWQKKIKLTIEEAEAAAAKDWIGFAEAYRRAFQNAIKFADFASAVFSR